MKHFLTKNMARAYVGMLTVGMLAQKAVAQSLPYTGHGGTNWGSFKDIVSMLVTFIGRRIMPIVVAIGVLTFFYNMIFFILKSDSPADREQFKKYSVNALIGLFIMLTVWGIVGIATNTLHWGLAIPQLPTSGQ